MSTLKNTLLAVLTVMVLSLAVLAWQQYRELVTLRGAVLTNGERADWQKRVWAAQKRPAGPEIHLAAPRPTAATPDSLPAPTPGGRADLGRLVANMTSMMDRPDTVRLIALQQKAQVDARYAALFKKLGLPPDQLAQLKSLLADKLAAPMDVMAAGGQQGIDPVRNPQEIRQLVQDAQTQIDEKIKALLDPGSYAQFQNYLQTEPQRTVVDQLQQSLSYTATPLTTAQADQLVQILAQTAPAAGGATPFGGTAVAYVNTKGAGTTFAVGTGPMPVMGGGPGWGGSPVTDTAVTQAQNVLSPPQVQALQEIQQQQQAAAQLRAQMFQRITTGPVAAPASGGPDARPPAPPPGG